MTGPTLRDIAKFLTTHCAAVLFAATTFTSAALTDDAPCQKTPDNFYEPMEDDTALPAVSPKSECLDKAKGAKQWTSPERWAWEQICRRQSINFDRLYCSSGQSGDRTKLDQDPRRHLSGAFIREVLELDELAPIARTGPVNIVGASIDQINITNAEIGSLHLSNTHIVSNVKFTNITVNRTITFSQSEVGGALGFRYVKGGNITVSDTVAEQILADQLNVALFRITASSVRNVDVKNSRLSEQLSILMGSYDSISLTGTKSDGLFIRVGDLTKFNMIAYADTGMFVLDVKSWTKDSFLNLHNVATGTFQLLGTDRLDGSERSVPTQTAILGFAFADADWGSDPLPYLKALMQTSKHYNPSIYAGLAKSYAAAGRNDVARDILIAQNDAELHSSSSPWFRKMYLWVTQFLVVYGYRPEIGLAWIFGFVLVGAVVFHTGARTVIGSKRPRNWFVFALDAVIPAIALDSEHEKIAFHGWRQGFLYFLRFLGAVVVVLIISYVRNAIVGTP
jgi:hypothetical protein